MRKKREIKKYKSRFRFKRLETAKRPDLQTLIIEASRGRAVSYWSCEIGIGYENQTFIQVVRIFDYND